MELNKTYITNKGRALMAKLSAGTKTYFTQVRTSTTEYPDNTPSSTFEALTALTNIKQAANISDVVIRDSVYVDVSAAISNKGLATGYKVGCFGFYAQDPDGGEILYAITPVKQGTGDWFPADNGVNASSIEVGLSIQVGNSANVTMQVDAGAYATVTMLNTVKADVQAIKDLVGLADKGVVGLEVDWANRTYKRMGEAKGLSAGTDFDKYIAFGGRKRCIVTDAGKVIYKGEPGYIETGKTTATGTAKDGTEVPAGTLAQVMVEQPKFYYRRIPLVTDPIVDGTGSHLRKWVDLISDEPKPGFKLHPAFIRNGEIKEYIYLSAFEGSTFDTSANAYLLQDEQVTDFSTDKLCSIVGAKPLSGKTQTATRTNLRTIAQKRGSGWELKDILAASVTQMLFTVEYAGFDTQLLLGKGVTDLPYVDGQNDSVVNGFTSALGNASGMASGEDGKVSIAYRGEENFYGNIWNWIDGLNVDRDSGTTPGKHDIYIADHGFVDNIGTDPYKKFQATACQNEGYCSAICYPANGEMDCLYIPSETKGASNTGTCDYFYRNPTYKGWLAARLGGDWGYGSQAGAFYLNLGNAASTRSCRIGGRALYVPAGSGAHS